MQRLQSIQALRGVAALAVFIAHLLTTVDPTTPLNLTKAALPFRSGVDLFFVISGFVMAYSVRGLDGPRDARVFIGRRLWRIVPLLYIVSAAYIGILVAYGQPLSLPLIVNCFTVLPLAPGPWNFNYALVPAWTLGFELAFYLIVTGVVASRLQPRWPVLMAAVSIAPLLFLSTLMIEFAFGVGAYWLWSSDRLKREFVLPLLCVAVIVFTWATMRYSTSIGSAFHWGVPAACVFVAALFWSHPPRLLLRLGDISYSLYLTHFMTFHALAPIFSSFGPAVLAAFLIPTSLLVAWLTYEAIEAPMQRWRALRDGVETRRRVEVTMLSGDPIGG